MGMSFSEGTVYGQGWEETGRESFLGASDIKGIEKGVVETKSLLSKYDGEYHDVTSICFYMKSGGFKAFQLSNQSALKDGDEVDLKSVECITFEDGDGEEHYRLDAKKKK